MASKLDPTAESSIVTKQDIDEIVGRLNDGAVATIIATGATRADLLEAYAWLAADDVQHRRLHSAPHGMVAQVLDILEADMPESEER